MIYRENLWTFSAAHCFVNDSTINTIPKLDDYSVVVSKFSRTYKVEDNAYQKTFKVQVLIGKMIKMNYTGEDSSECLIKVVEM